MYLEAKPPKLETQLVPNACSQMGVIACLLDLIEDDTAGLVYSEESDNSRNHCEYSQQLKV